MHQQFLQLQSLARVLLQNLQNEIFGGIAHFDVVWKTHLILDLNKRHCYNFVELSLRPYFEGDPADQQLVCENPNGP